MTPFFLFRCFDPLRRYLRSNFEVVRNQSDFCTFFALPIFWSARTQIYVPSYPHYHICLAARQVAKYRGAAVLAFKVINADTLNFKPIFDSFLYKNCWKTPVASGVCASQLWSFLACLKI